MATTATTGTVLLITIILSISTITTTARPCKTIFFITSTTTTSYYPTTNHPLQNPNPNPNPNPRLTFFITEIHHFHRTRPLSHHTFTHHSSPNDVVSSKPYFPSSSPSIRDRTMDIMSIVGALLFGVGCGALTAGTIYLVWSLFSSNRAIDFDSDDSDVESVDDDVTPNKNGYVAVANKEVPPSADEVDAMKK